MCFESDARKDHADDSDLDAVERNVAAAFSTRHQSGERAFIIRGARRRMGG
jgi:hypothetical protein